MDGRLLVVHGRPESVHPAARRARSARRPCTPPPTTARTAGAGTTRVEKALRDKDIELVTTGSPYAVAPGPGAQARRRPVRGVHAVLPRLDRARLAGGRRDPGDGGQLDRPGRTSTAPSRHDPAELGRDDPRRPAICPSPARRPRWPTWQDFLDARGRRLRRRPQPPRSRWHQPDVAVPEVGLHPPADAAGRPGQAPQLGGAASYRRELAWREFYADVVFHLPSVDLDVGRPGHRQDGLGQRAGGGRPVRRLEAGPDRLSRTSTPGCGSCWPRAGCTTGCGWASRPS